MEGDDLFRQPLKAIKGCLHNCLQRFRSAATAAAEPVPPLAEDDLLPDRRLRAFPGEMFARLLLELPEHRSQLAAAYQAGDLQQLKNNLHQLLGGAAYCDAPELTTGLHELRRALESEDPQTIELYYLRAIDVIDATLRYSGYQD